MHTRMPLLTLIVLSTIGILLTIAGIFNGDVVGTLLLQAAWLPALFAVLLDEASRARFFIGIGVAVICVVGGTCSTVICAEVTAPPAQPTLARISRLCSAKLPACSSRLHPDAFAFEHLRVEERVDGEWAMRASSHADFELVVCNDLDTRTFAIIHAGYSCELSPHTPTIRAERE